MIGCIALTAFVGLAAFKVIRHRRHCHGGGWGPHHRRHRGGPRSFLWHALARLDLSPAQEKVVRAEVDELKKKARTLKDEGSSARGDMARSIRTETFEEGALAAMFIRHDDLLHGLRGDLAGALGRIHAVLDPEQRERLADLIESGAGRAWGGPYR